MIRLEPYRRTLAEAAFRRSLWPSVLARLPLGMASLSLLLAVQAQTGSNRLAGIASGLYVLGLGIVAPLAGRAIDRFGPGPLLRLTGLVYPAVMTMLAWAVASGQPAWLWMLLAVLGGVSLPHITAQMRSAIPGLLPGRAEQQVAFTIDTLVIEFVFMVGPPLAGLFLALGQPLAATLAAGACGGFGAWWFLTTPAVRGWAPHPGRASERSLLGALRESGLRAILASCLFYALCFGLFEAGIASYCQQLGAPQHTGWLLGITSITSASAVLLYGSREWGGRLALHYRLGMLATGALLLVCALAGDLLTLYLLAALASTPMATVLAAQNMLVVKVAPAGRVAECYTWVGTSLLFGVSGGLAAGGLLSGSDAAPLAIAAAGVSALLAAAVAWRAVRHIGA
ncbi:MAG: MFS transporter [Rhodocyclaceae bacterium]|nr:MFS transporter [Rhodocyclaceae bacterium]